MGNAARVFRDTINHKRWNQSFQLTTVQPIVECAKPLAKHQIGPESE